MGSKKLRNQRKSNTVLPTSSPSPALSEKKAAISNDIQKPIYTVFFMIIGIVLLSFLFTVIVNTFITDYYMSLHPELGNDIEAIRAGVEEFIYTKTIFIVLRRVAISLAGILSMLILFGKIEQKSFAVIGFEYKEKRTFDILIGLAFGLIAMLVLYNFLLIFGFVQPSGTLIFSLSQIYWTFEILLMCIFEELFFRGYLLYKLKKFKPVISIAIISVIFSIYKGITVNSPGIFLSQAAMSILLTFAAIRFKSLWFPLTFRFMWTFASAILLSVYSVAIEGMIANNGLANNIIAGGASVENGIMASGVLIICFVLVMKMAQTREKPKAFTRKLHSDGTIR